MVDGALPLFTAKGRQAGATTNKCAGNVGSKSREELAQGSLGKEGW